MSENTLEATPAEQATPDEQSVIAENAAAEAAAEDAAPSDQQAEPEGEAPADAPKPAKKHSVQQRINELTREKYEAQREAERYRNQVAQAQQYIQQQQTAQTGQVPFPTIEQYDYDQGRYQQAVEQWVSARDQAAAEMQRQAHAEHMARQQQYQTAVIMQQRVSEAVERHPDFLLKVQDPQLPSFEQLSPAGFRATMESEHFGDIMYHLAGNPAELYRFGELGPIEAVKAVAALETKFDRQAKRSNAVRPPPPPKTVKTTPDSAPSLADDVSIEDWMKARNAQVYKS